MSKADELLAKETLTRDEVLDLLMERKREWAQENAPALEVTPELLQRFVSEYAKAYSEFSGSPVTTAAIQRLLVAVFGEVELCRHEDLAKVYNHPLEADSVNNGHQVLAIDDDPMMLALIRQLLKREGIIVDTAETGPEGLLKFQRQHFDLVLLDYEMPGMNGPEVCVKLKEKMADAAPLRGKIKNVPVVFLTGKTAKDNVISAVQAGGVGYIAKPFTPPELVAKVRKYLPVQQTAGSVVGGG